MLWKIFLLGSHFYCCWCQATYELDVEGEAQHGYYVNVNIGHPEQSIKFIIDTGSANLAVAVIPTLNNSKNFFHYNESSTFQKLDSNIEIRYVQGVWNGFLAKDFVSVHKNDFVRCTISCMTSIYNVFDINSKFGGILGLAYPSVSKPNSSVLPFFDTIKKAENIKDVFSLSLCGPFFSDTSTRTSCGKLHLGFVSRRHYLNEIVYTPIVKEELYEVTLTTIKVGSETINIDCKELNNPRSAVDSGTTQLLLPAEVFGQVVSKIKKYISCEIHSLNWTENVNNFWLNETAACIPKKYFNISFFPELLISFYHTDNSNFDIVISPELYLLPCKQEVFTGNVCFTLGIGQSDFGTIIGSTLLKGYYVIFDRLKRRIGFANSSSLQTVTKLISYVKTPQFNQGVNYSSCKHIESSNPLKNADISIGTIILLLFILILAVVFLYRISIWFRTIRLLKSDDSRSDTSSLVDEDYKIQNF